MTEPHIAPALTDGAGLTLALTVAIASDDAASEMLLGTATAEELRAALIAAALALTGPAPLRVLHYLANGDHQNPADGTTDGDHQKEESK